MPKTARPADEPGAELLAASELESLVQRRLAEGRPTGLILFHSYRFDEVSRDRGARVAGRLTSDLAAVLRERLRPDDRLGDAGEGAVALLVDGPLEAAQLLGHRLHQALRRELRFPIATGVSHACAAAGAGSLLRLAREAAAESREGGASIVCTLTAQGRLSMPELPAAPAHGWSTELSARYQRLVLLNRISLELFSERPFAESLAASAEITLALMSAKYVAFYFADELGMPAPALRRGDGAFMKLPALVEEKRLVLSAIAGQTVVWSDKEPALGVAPLLHLQGSNTLHEGALVVGYLDPPQPHPERDRTLVEIGRLLRNARLIQKTLEQQRTLAAVTEQSADAIFVTDLDGRIVRWNSSASQLFGHDAPEAVGRRVGELVGPEGRIAELLEYEQRTLQDGVLRGFETLLKRKDGSLVPVEGTYTLLRSADARPFAIVRVFRDITKRKEIERMKSEFVSLVSHELRTPLTAIRGFAETLAEAWEELDAERRGHYLRIIVDEAKRLGLLVNDFLDVSRLEAGGVPLKPKKVRLAALLDRLEALFHGHHSGAALAFRLAPAAELVYADEDQLYRILLNLCGNALKYAPRQSLITIEAKDRPDAVELSVSDQGPGIAPKDRERVFQRFFRVSDAVSKKTAGTGLGLAICQGIVEAHGGRIWVEEAAGGGACFKFTLPKKGAA